ncbi:MAG: methyltransferase domain-containing protein, partial [Acetobacteraceae bacterium]
MPGGAEDVLRLATPLGLSAASSLLLLGCGAGGPARCIATLFGAWVAGYEADPALVAAAATICARAGLGKRVRIDAWDPIAPAFPVRSCHHVLALDPFRQGAPAPILDALTRALRPGGQMTLLATIAGPEYDHAAEDSAA